MKKNEQYFSCFSYADRIAGVNVGPSQQWTNPCLLASGVLPSDTGKGDANKVSCFGQRRPIYKWFFFGWLGVQLFRRLSSLPCKKKHNCTCPDPIQSEEWSREWPRLILTQQAHTTKPAVVAQKQASILCWLSPTWPHMTERWNGPTIWWVRHCTWWQEDENDSWCKNCIFLQTILFSSFRNICCFFSSLSFFGFFLKCWPRHICKENHICQIKSQQTRLRIPDTRMLVVTLWATYGNDLCDVWRCRAFVPNNVLRTIYPRCKKKTPATQPRCRLIQVCQKSRRTTGRSWAQHPGKKLIACVCGCLCGDCLSV